jgi:hypothetical protein
MSNENMSSLFSLKKITRIPSLKAEEMREQSAAYFCEWRKSRVAAE